MNYKVLVPNWFDKYHFAHFADMDEERKNYCLKLITSSNSVSRISLV